MGLAHFLFYGNYSEPCKYHIICGKAAYLARKRQDFRVYGMKYNLKTGEPNMSKYSVKKPFTVLVAVVMLLVLGIVSFTKMTTDLLPSISLPYILVITTYPGASPEKVENDVTQVLESALGTVNGVENVTSVSNENYSMITLEFAEDTNMDSAMVKLSSQIDQIELPDMAGTPSLLEISPDMMATCLLYTSDAADE